MIDLYLNRSVYSNDSIKILKASFTEICSYPFLKMSIEDLDLVIRRLKKLKIDHHFIIELILTKKEKSSVINYANYFELIILHFLNLNYFQKAKKFLKLYYIHLQLYMTKEKELALHFIKKQLKILKLKKEKYSNSKPYQKNPKDPFKSWINHKSFFDYYSLISELYFLNEKKLALKYLKKGLEKSKKGKHKKFFDFFISIKNDFFKKNEL